MLRIRSDSPQEVSMKLEMITITLLAFSTAGCAGSGNGGATGAAPERYIGERPNVNGTWNGSTSSSSMLMQRIKQDSPNGAPSGGATTQYCPAIGPSLETCSGSPNGAGRLRRSTRGRPPWPY